MRSLSLVAKIMYIRWADCITLSVHHRKAELGSVAFTKVSLDSAERNARRNMKQALVGVEDGYFFPTCSYTGKV